MRLRNVAAIAAVSILAGTVTASAQEEGGINEVGSQFLGIMKEYGWTDASYERIAGDESLFEIRGFKGSRKGADGKPESVSFSVLTVEGLDPGDRWLRAASMRADGLHVVTRGGDVSIATIYAKKPGLLDVDIGRPAATFEMVAVAGAKWSRDGAALADLSEVYLSGDRWVGEYGIPGKLDVTAKGAFSAAILSGVPVLQALGGAGTVNGEFALKSSLSTTRDELTASASFSTGKEAWSVSSVLMDFDTALFKAWFDLKNPEQKRTDDDTRIHRDAFEHEVEQVGVKSFEIGARGGNGQPSPMLSALGSGLAAWVPGAVSPETARAIVAAVQSFAKTPTSLSLSAYAVGGVPLNDILSGGTDGKPFAKFQYKVSK
jgi:hypothetical protein